MLKTDLSSYNNRDFKIGRNKFVVILWYVVGRICIHTYLPLPMWFKRAVLRLFGAKVGVGLIIKPKVNIKYPWRLSIGNHCWIGEQVWIDNLDMVTMGNNVCISQGAMLLTGNHNYKKPSFDLITNPIVLEDGVWIGAKAVVCPGVTAGYGSVFSVGAMLTKNTAPLGIYSGNPATKLMERIIS